jgi:hypothetical protein
VKRVPQELRIRATGLRGVCRLPSPLPTRPTNRRPTPSPTPAGTCGPPARSRGTSALRRLPGRTRQGPPGPEPRQTVGPVHRHTAGRLPARTRASARTKQLLRPLSARVSLHNVRAFAHPRDGWATTGGANSTHDKRRSPGYETRSRDFGPRCARRMIPRKLPCSDFYPPSPTSGPVCPSSCRHPRSS